MSTPLIGVVMGSQNDYAVMKSAVEILREFNIPHEARVVSAHRTPDLLFQYAEQAQPRGLRIIIAGAGGAAHLPGMLAAKTIVPVFGVPISATALQGIDALLSIVQMPKGVPVATFAIGAAGAANAALFAVATLATSDPSLAAKLTAWRNARRDEVLAQSLDAPEIRVPHLRDSPSVAKVGESPLPSPECTDLPGSFLAEKTHHSQTPSTESTIDRLEESAL